MTFGQIRRARRSRSLVNVNIRGHRMSGWIDRFDFMGCEVHMTLWNGEKISTYPQYLSM